MMRRLTNDRLALLLLLALSPAQAVAYVDPNVGGVLFQWLAPLFALIIVLWGRLKYVASLLLRKIRDVFFRGRE